VKRDRKCFSRETGKEENRTQSMAPTQQYAFNMLFFDFFLSQNNKAKTFFATIMVTTSTVPAGYIF